MNKAYRALVKDTCAFLKQEGHQLKKASLPMPPKQELPKPPIKPAPIPPPMPTPEPSKPPLPKEETSLLFDKIQKHLPHVRLVQTIPQMKQIAILCINEVDRPFLKKLASAIGQRFFPVTILSNTPASPYFLIITQQAIEGLDEERQIVLEPIAEYENNIEQKKQLWSKICHRLSQKSS